MRYDANGRARQWLRAVAALVASGHGIPACATLARRTRLLTPPLFSQAGGKTELLIGAIALATGYGKILVVGFGKVDDGVKLTEKVQGSRTPQDNDPTGVGIALGRGKESRFHVHKK